MEINWLTVILVLSASIVSGYLYWAGGEGGPWYRNTKVRDWGCNTIAVALAWYLNGQFDSGLAVAWFLLWGALATYWKQGPDCQWYHWLFTGLGYGGSFIIFASNTEHLCGWLLYTVVLGALTSFWSVNTSRAKAEAAGRGALIQLLMPLMFIW